VTSQTVHIHSCGIRVGVKHLENCPVEPYIPIYLLVGGCFGLLKVLSMLWMQVRYRRYRTVDDSVDDDDDDDDAEPESGGSSRTLEYSDRRMASLGQRAAAAAGH